MACRGSGHGQLHNVFGQTMIQGTYEGLQKVYVEKAKSQNAPPQRPFIIARGGYAGARLSCFGLHGQLCMHSMARLLARTRIAALMESDEAAETSTAFCLSWLASVTVSV